MLKIYTENHSTVNDEDSYNSSEIEEVDDNRNENSDDDSSYESELVQLVNIGDEYQAQIESSDVYPVPIDELLWSSSSLDDSDNENIDEYLRIIHTEYPASDDEISLRTLLNCQLNTELALEHFRQLSRKNIYTYSAWSLAEIEEFEQGLREFGKNFSKISHFKCSNRSVREIVYFYYQWKKSERYEIFLEQQRFRPFTSVSHMIEKFIEEQDIYARKSSALDDSAISIVTKRSFDQVDNDDETTVSAKKTSIEIPTTTVA